MLPAFSITPAALTSLVTAIAALGAISLLWRRRRLAGTTLVAVWMWSLVSLAAIALVELLVAALGGDPPQPWIAPLRLAATTSSFCPIMALLGAKRPQDRGWQFIVIALWVILCLPAAHWLLFGGVREIHPAQIGLLAVLIGAGAMNGLLTSHWPSAVLYALGQVALLGPYLNSLEPWLAGERGPLAGLALLMASWLLLALRADRSCAATGLDRVWLDFRDAFGAVWGLRVMERMNASAAMYGWPVTLTWQGFEPHADFGDVTEVPPAVEDSLRTLLRRFVSPEWIDRRLGERRAEPSSTSGDGERTPLSAGGAAP